MHWTVKMLNNKTAFTRSLSGVIFRFAEKAIVSRTYIFKIQHTKTCIRNSDVYDLECFLQLTQKVIVRMQFNDV
jgi:hypothetical protein